MVSPRKQSAIYVGPLSLILGTIAWEYERAIGERTSLAIGAPLSFPFGVMGSLSSAAGVSYFGIGGMLGLRQYFTDHALQGLFAGSELNIGVLSASNVSGASATAVSYGVTGLVGYSVLTDGGFALSGGLGVSVGSFGLAATSGDRTAVGAAPIGVSPALRLHVGYAF